MEMMNYAQQMKRPEWQKKRLEVLEANNFECVNCGEKEEQLHVHHPFYTKGAMIWQYETDDLQCLCYKCHKDAHALDERIKKVVAALAGPCLKNQALGYLEALQGKIPLYPKTYEYCLGVADAISYLELPLKTQNSLNDEIETWITQNTGKDGLFFMQEKAQKWNKI